MPRSIVRAIGSLWFAAVLLMVWLVAMALATVVESAQGTERALVEFYHARWFQLLLGLLAVNMLAAVVVRYPFTRRQLGFVLTHGGILITLGGAVVTDRWAVNGRAGLAEGQSTEDFTISQDVLTVVNLRSKASSTVDLEGPAFGGLEQVTEPEAPPLSLADLRAEVELYLPDGDWVRQVTNDNPGPHPAVEVSLSADGRGDPTWLFADESMLLGAVQATFLVASDESGLQRMLNPPAANRSASDGVVSVEYKDATFEFSLTEGMEKPLPLGDTGFTARVLRYLPHALVGAGNKLENASDRPVNPAVEVEIVGPAGTEKRTAFARFPDFESMHGGKGIEGLKVRFSAPTEADSHTPLEVIGGPEDKLFARFTRHGGEAVVRELAVGIPVETPWPGRKLAVLRRFDHARVDWLVEPAEPVRKERTPAVLVKLSAEEHANSMWVQKYKPRRVTMGGARYEVQYHDKLMPLGFTLKLNQFRVGYYPGTQRPRSYESHVTIVDPATGRSQDRIISMNNPTEYAGYSLFQSSYNLAGGQRTSFLSVSRDPGLPIVYAGYVVTLLGMVVVMVTRMADHRRAQRGAESGAGGAL